MNNVWLDSDTVRHESVQKMNYYTDSRIDYSKEVRPLQGNAIQIPKVLTQRANANIEKTKNSLKESLLKHPKKVCLSYINISSIRNKLEPLSEFVCTPVDFLAISETKLGSSFPTAQFILLGFTTPYRKVVTARSGGYLYM